MRNTQLLNDGAQIKVTAQANAKVSKVNQQLDGVEQNGGELFLFFKGLTTIHITVNGKKVIFQGFVDHNPYYCKLEKWFILLP